MGKNYAFKILISLWHEDIVSADNRCQYKQQNKIGVGPFRVG